MNDYEATLLAEILGIPRDTLFTLEKNVQRHGFRDLKEYCCGFLAVANHIDKAMDRIKKSQAARDIAATFRALKADEN